MSKPDRDQLIDQLAGAVLDGAAVDWAAVESRAGSDEEPIFQYLQLVASVARIHRDALPVETWGPLRLVERVGRGATGDVFRAWDTRLDREVALKLILSPLSPDDAAANAIVREGRLLARVRHPNVVTIHGAERIGGRTGLWMEFVHGQTLDELFHQGTTFETSDVIGIGIELCRALSAVHGAGLLHRDIKAHNVMRATDGRIVLMDFGAGRELDDESPADVAGTPLYLAPELFGAGLASVQTDLYSLGVLLYRLASGGYPVSGRSIRELRAAHAAGDRVAARELQPVIAPGLAGLIDQAIDPRPEQRPPTADALAAGLVKLQRRMRLRPLVQASAIGATVVAAGIAIWAVVPRAVTPPATDSTAAAQPGAATAGVAPPAPGPALATRKPVRIRPSLQVVPFVNVSAQSETGWLSAALAEMMVRELRASEAFRWIPAAPTRTFSQLATLLSGPMYVRWTQTPDIVVSGEYAASSQPGQQPTDLQLTVSITERSGGRGLTTLTEAGRTSEIRQLMSRVGTKTRAALAVPALPDDHARALAASQPANAVAARAYAEGLFRNQDVVPAMERALVADPGFAPAQIALGEALVTRRDLPRAHQAATRAVELAAGLPFEERQIIAARAAIVTAGGGRLGQHAEAVARIWEGLHERYPDTLLYGAAVVRAHQRAQRFEQALATMNVVSLLPGASDDHELLSLEASLAAGAGDFVRAQLALDRGAMAATSAGDREQLGHIRVQQARLAMDLGNPTAVVTFVEAARLAGRSADESSADMLAVAYRTLGDFTRARTTIEAHITSARTRKSPAEEFRWRFGLAYMLIDQGALQEAGEVLRQLKRDGPASVGTFDTEDAQMALADVHYRRGDLTAARHELDQLTPHSRRRARVLWEQGDLAGARETVKRSLQVMRWNNAGTRGAIDWTLALQARTELAAGETAAARRTIDGVAPPPSGDSPRRSLREPERRDAFDVVLVRSLVALQEQRWSESRTAARTAIALARADFRADDEAAGESVVALAWLGEGNVPEASAAIGRAAKRLRVTEDRLLRLSGGIAAARVGAAAGTPAAFTRARQDLDNVIQQADTIGAVPIAFDARLALGEIELKSGQVAPGRQRLEALARDASGRGFTWIATKAGALAK
jgi:serine/threonine-protein kinase